MEPSVLELFGYVLGNWKIDSASEEFVQALAKLRGCYSACDGGSEAEGLVMLTGIVFIFF